MFQPSQGLRSSQEESCMHMISGRPMNLLGNVSCWSEQATRLKTLLCSASSTEPKTSSVPGEQRPWDSTGQKGSVRDPWYKSLREKLRTSRTVQLQRLMLY